MKKPNFVFILTDDQSFWAIHKETKEIISPTIDSMADNGAYFKNFFCACPVCSPARASILTGLMPSCHGVQDWLISGNVNKKEMPDFVQNRPPIKNNENFAIDYLEGFTTYTDVLADNGYNIALSGKWHLGDTLKKRKGYVFWNTILRGGCSYKSYDLYEDGKISSHEQYLTDKITENAIDFVKNYNSDAPFYLGVHYTAPHTPWEREEHKEAILQKYDKVDFSEIENGKIHQDQTLHKYIGDTAEKREEWLKGYFAAITAVDENLSKLIQALKEENKFDDTIFIFTGDNGNNLGQHGVWGKGNGTYPQNMYEESIKVPYIMYSPKYIEQNEISQLCSHVDIFPTILDFAGVKYDYEENMWGKSLKSVLNGESVSRNHVTVFDEYGAVRMIRTERFKFIKNYKTDEEILFDLAIDQKERINLVADEKYIKTANKLREALESGFKAYTSQKDGVFQDNFGVGQTSYINGKNEANAFKTDLKMYYDNKEA